MKMFRRIFALTMVIAMVCLFSASAFAGSYSVSQDFGDVDDCFAGARAEIDRYETWGRLEVGGVMQDKYLYIKLDHRYVESESGVETQAQTAIRQSNETDSLYLEKVYNSSIIRRLTEATYTFYASITNMDGQELELSGGPATIQYN